MNEFVSQSLRLKFLEMLVTNAVKKRLMIFMVEL